MCQGKQLSVDTKADTATKPLPMGCKVPFQAPKPWILGGHSNPWGGAQWLSPLLGIKILGVATASVRAPVVPGWDGAGRGVRCQIYQGLFFSPHPPSPATLGKVMLLILNKYPFWAISLFAGPKWPLQATENFLLMLRSSGKKLDPSAG